MWSHTLKCFIVCALKSVKIDDSQAINFKTKRSNDAAVSPGE